MCISSLKFFDGEDQVKFCQDVKGFGNDVFPEFKFN